MKIAPATPFAALFPVKRTLLTVLPPSPVLRNASAAPEPVERFPLNVAPVMLALPCETPIAP